MSAVAGYGEIKLFAGSGGHQLARNPFTGT
jgi:hypothetical protein